MELARVEELSGYCVNVFYLARLPFSSYFGWREQYFVILGFFLSIPIGVLGLSASLAPSLGYVRKTEAQGTHHRVGLWFSMSFIGLPSYHVILCLFYT